MKKFEKMKLIDYTNICQIKDFNDFKNGCLEENSFYIVKKRENIDIIRPTMPLFADIIPNSCTTNDFYLASIRNGVCIKNQIIVYNNKYILPDSFRHYDLYSSHRSLQYDVTSDSFYLKEKINKVGWQPGNTIFLSGENSNGFGHFLLEVVSRLWITKYIDINKYTFILNTNDRQQWQLDLLLALGVKPKQMIYLHQPTECERLHIPVQSFVLRKYTSSVAAYIWRKIGDYYDNGVGPKKIYVSRSKLNNRRRTLINEVEVENLFKSYGFMVIHPQELSIKNQINFFRNANMIAGPSGSAMYNCVFQTKPTQKLILTPRNFFKKSDVLINTSTRGQLHYFVGDTINNTSPVNIADWVIDIVKLKKCLTEIFKL